MTAALTIRGMCKHFAGAVALDNVDLSVSGGEVHALLGQNGSGKSTLVKIITGVHTPDQGTVEMWGEPMKLPVRSAHEHGIAVIHQDLGLVDSMTVLENLGIVARYGARLWSPISFRSERARCRELLGELGLDINPDTLLSELASPARAAVAVARAKRVLQDHTDRFVFILDEPTAHLNAEEAERVLRLMRIVARDGSAVIFISHRMQEVLGVADRITVLRDGKAVDTFEAGEGDERRIISAMLGRSLSQYYPDRAVPVPAPPALIVENLVGRRLGPVSFEVSPGEIVGLTGLEGMGHGDVARLLAGTHSADSGSAKLAGTDLLACSLRDRIRLGVAYVPGNRGRDGIWPAASAQENITLPQLALGSPWRRLRLRDERRGAEANMIQFQVRPPRPGRRVDQFSGGNQQKVVLAKWLARDPSLLLLDEPTQGIDAGAKLEILQMISDFARRDAVVLVFSGDYEQLANICNRVLVFRHGSIAGELREGKITENGIAQLAQGAKLTNELDPGDPTPGAVDELAR